MAQNYEFGVHGGASLFQKKTITNPTANADASFSMGYGGGFTLGHNQYERVGGEIRYNFLVNKMKLKSGSTEAEFDGQTHTFHYDFLLHTADRGAKVRPYVAVGGGIRQYRGTGTETAFQPLSNIAILTKTQDVKPVLSVGGGVKYALSEKMALRVDVHDYITPFPKEVITPATNSSVSGILNNIVASVGLTFTF